MENTKRNTQKTEETVIALINYLTPMIAILL
jgi:hypothetical protein